MKKILLAIGSLSAIAAPIVAVVSCGNDKKPGAKHLAQNQNPKTEETQEPTTGNTDTTPASTGSENTPAETTAPATNENTGTEAAQVNEQIEALKPQFKTALTTAFTAIQAEDVSNVEIKNEGMDITAGGGTAHADFGATFTINKEIQNVELGTVLGATKRAATTVTATIEKDAKISFVGIKGQGQPGTILVYLENKGKDPIVALAKPSVRTMIVDALSNLGLDIDPTFSFDEVKAAINNEFTSTKTEDEINATLTGLLNDPTPADFGITLPTVEGVTFSLQRDSFTDGKFHVIVNIMHGEDTEQKEIVITPAAATATTEVATVSNEEIIATVTKAINGQTFASTKTKAELDAAYENGYPSAEDLGITLPELPEGVSLDIMFDKEENGNFAMTTGVLFDSQYLPVEDLKFTVTPAAVASVVSGVEVPPASMIHNTVAPTPEEVVAPTPTPAPAPEQVVAPEVVVDPGTPEGTAMPHLANPKPDPEIKPFVDVELVESTQLASSSSVTDIYAPLPEVAPAKELLEVEAVAAQLEGQTFAVGADAHKLALMADAERTFTAEHLNIAGFTKAFANVDLKFIVTKDALGNFTLTAFVKEAGFAKTVEGIKISSILAPEAEVSVAPAIATNANVETDVVAIPQGATLTPVATHQAVPTVKPKAQTVASTERIETIAQLAEMLWNLPKEIKSELGHKEVAEMLNHATTLTQVQLAKIGFVPNPMPSDVTATYTLKAPYTAGPLEITVTYTKGDVTLSKVITPVLAGLPIPVL